MLPAPRSPPCPESWLQGQPALLYLVPCTVGAVSLLAAYRAQFTALWHGTTLSRADGESSAHPDAARCCDYHDNTYHEYAYDANYPDGLVEEAHKQL